MPVIHALVAALLASPVGSACLDVHQGQEAEPVVGASAPLVQLGVDRAQELAPGLGEGANVAVVDSGVYGEPRVRVVARESFVGATDEPDPHGTAVAGVIAGQPRADGQAVGIAPGAGIVDVHVYNDALDPGRVADGLNWVADNADRYDIAVANVSLAFDYDVPSIERAVQRLWRHDVVVVAASGNRPDQEGEPGYPDLEAPMNPGEDAAGVFRPASYPHVLAVNASAPPGDDVTSYVVQSSDTDVAAPTLGLVSVAVTGEYCVINEVATSWSAAVVSGVLALLRSAYPDDTAAQAVARLIEAANGTPGTPTRLTGYGVVQPVEALTRPLAPDSDGALARTTASVSHPRATAPVPASDLLSGPRDDAMWWGLIGGGVLVVALLLRPVVMLSRGRRGPRPPRTASRS